MSNGHFRTFDEFTSPQSACDSGEPLLMPCGTPIDLSVPLVANHPLHLVGHGADTQVAGSAASMFTTSVANMPMLVLNPTAHNSRISGIAFQASATGGTGIVLGDGTTDHLRGVILDGISTNPNLFFGIHVLAAGGFVIDKCWLWGNDAALRLENRMSADTGDNKITDTDFNAAGATGCGLKWTSGGGLYMKGNKFNTAATHIYMDWSLAASGGLVAVGNSFESCSGISVDLRGEFGFERMMFTGNTWGGIPSVAIASRNFCSSNWLKDLSIVGNTFSAWGASPILDMGCTDNAWIATNVFRGNNIATPSVMIRNGTGAVGTNRHYQVSQAVSQPSPAIWSVDGQI